MNQNLLPIELRLLVLKYGPRRVLETFAEIKEVSVEEIERQVRQCSEHPNARVSKDHKSEAIENLVAALKVSDAAKENSILTLARQFELGAFLPTLREVSGFLSRHGLERRHLKSRRQSLPIVLKALGDLSAVGLDELIKDMRSSPVDGDYELLANQIMAGGSVR